MPKQFYTFVPADELPEGSREVFDVGNMSILLLNVNGEYFAVENLCSHAAYTLENGALHDGCQLECPTHGAIFDIRTGEALSAPAYTPIKTFATRVENGEIQVELDIET